MTLQKEISNKRKTYERQISELEDSLMKVSTGLNSLNSTQVMSLNTSCIKTDFSGTKILFSSRDITPIRSLEQTPRSRSSSVTTKPFQY